MRVILEFIKNNPVSVIIVSLGLLAWFVTIGARIESKKSDRFVPPEDFDSDKQIAVIKCSICTGEQVAGFKSKEDGHFTEVMLIRGEKDLERFKEIYNISEIKKEY